MGKRSCLRFTVTYENSLVTINNVKNNKDFKQGYECRLCFFFYLRNVAKDNGICNY